MEVREESAEIGGVQVNWRSAGERPVLYVHGVPTGSWLWEPFLDRIGGVAPNLPGFGHSDKRGDFDHSIEGFADFLEGFTAHVGLERLTLVVQDWGGGVGLAFAQRAPERIERLVVMDSVPFLPGYRWHRIARLWRTPVVGELAMGLTTKWVLRRALGEAFTADVPEGFFDHVWEAFDQGTQRAILRLYRASPEPVLEAAGARLGELRCPALVLWGEHDPYVPVRFGQAYAEALGGEVTYEPVDAGHWPWLDRPELVERIAAFIAGP